MDKDRLVLLADTDLNTIGGAQESIKNMFRFPSAEWAIATSHAVPEGLGVRHIEMSEGVVGLPFCGHRIASPREVAELICELDEYYPDKIILNHPGLFLSSVYLQLPQDLKLLCVAMWRGVVNSKPSIIEEGRREPKYYLRHLFWPTIRRIQRLVANQMINLAPSMAVADSLLNIGVEASKIRMIQEQVGGEFTPELRLSDNEGFRRKFLDQDTLGVLVVSRISPEKGIGWVVDLYEKMRVMRKHLPPNSSFRKVRISLVGPAREGGRQYLERILRESEQRRLETSAHYASGSVVFDYLGPKGYDDLRDLYSTYDVLFMPSPAEGFGRVTVEAMNTGMTVIGRRDCLATREILSRPCYDVGILVGTPGEAAVELLGLMEEGALLKRLQERALVWSSGCYSPLRAESSFLEAVNASC